MAVATKVISERSNLGVDPVPGAAQVAVLTKIGPIFVASGDVKSQADDRRGARHAASTPRSSTHADPGRFE